MSVTDTKKTTGKPVPNKATTKEAPAVPPVLDFAAVGEYLGQRRDGKPLSARTIRIYLTESTPGPGHRYADHPFPAPSGHLGTVDGGTRAGVPYWLPDRLPELEAWDDARVGRGAGGGRPPLVAPSIDDGYVPCGDCTHPLERHDRTGCHPRKGTCNCTQKGWTEAKVRGARKSAGLAEQFTVEGATV